MKAIVYHEELLIHCLISWIVYITSQLRSSHFRDLWRACYDSTCLTRDINYSLLSCTQQRFGRLAFQFHFLAYVLTAIENKFDQIYTEAAVYSLLSYSLCLNLMQFLNSNKCVAVTTTSLIISLSYPCFVWMFFIHC